MTTSSTPITETMSSPNFPCTKCGACCRRAREYLLPPGFWHNGACRFLRGDECSIYETRPKICRVKTRFRENAAICNQWMDEELFPGPRIDVKALPPG